MTEAPAHLRVSDKGQISGDGFPRQRDAIRRDAKAYGIEIVAKPKPLSGVSVFEYRPAASRAYSEPCLPQPAEEFVRN